MSKKNPAGAGVKLGRIRDGRHRHRPQKSTFASLQGLTPEREKRRSLVVHESRRRRESELGSPGRGCSASRRRPQVKFVGWSTKVGRHATRYEEKAVSDSPAKLPHRPPRAAAACHRRWQDLGLFLHRGQRLRAGPGRCANRRAPQGAASAGCRQAARCRCPVRHHRAMGTAHGSCGPGRLNPDPDQPSQRVARVRPDRGGRGASQRCCHLSEAVRGAAWREAAWRHRDPRAGRWPRAWCGCRW